ncbi:nucleolar protein 12-domain-containing protein [Xylariaceae sp. FL0804]|nr:nucleolar protein 12-domain-containing protein [Xylariaceae sp. FL0804]
MFARPRPKKLALGMPPKKRRAQHAVEEVKFDDAARSDYLTGFHKRKLQRARNAQEQAAKRARQEKLEMRKQVRDERRREVEDHVQQVNAILKEAEQAGYVGEGGSSGGEDDPEEWGGLQDEPAPEPVDHEEEYVDEERYTTVTVESVNVSRDGLTSSKPDKEQDEDESGEEGREAADGAQLNERSSEGKAKSHPPKKKKPKFRYETKVERQFTQRIQKARNKRKRE